MGCKVRLESSHQTRVLEKALRQAVSWAGSEPVRAWGRLSSADRGWQERLPSGSPPETVWTRSLR